MAAKKKKKTAAKATKKAAKKATKKKTPPTKKAAQKKKAAAPKKKSAPKKKAAPKKAAPKKAAPKKAAPKKAAPKKAASVAKPAAPVAKPVAPVTKPVAPVAKPVAPVAKPVAPVAAPAAPARAPKAVRPAGPADPTVDLAQAVAALALDKKAEEVIILKVTDLTSYADCFILASAPSERQVQAIARHVADEMKKAGKTPVGIEGLEQGHWVLVDLGAVVLHVFLSSARRYYDLEGFWSDAPRIDADEAHGLEVLKKMAAAHKAANAPDNESAQDDDELGAASDAG